MLGHDPLAARPLSDVAAGSAASTDVTRGPVVIRREVRHWPIPPQSVNLLVTTLAPVVAAPFVPKDWPVPRGYSRIAYSATSQALNLTTLATPVGAQACETPRARGFDPALRTWLQSLVTTTLAAPDAAPFTPIAFPNPITKRTGVDGLTWAQSPAVPVADTPPVQSTTPNPVLRVWSPVNLTWTQSPAVTPSDTTTVLRAPLFAPRITARSVDGYTQRAILDTTPAPDPQVQRSQDLPVRRKWDANLYTWSQSPAVPAPTVAPFVQSNTPNPVLRKWGVSNLTWVQVPPGPDAVAPSFAAWDNPLVGRVRIENRTWLQPGQINAPTASPFVPVDFANPVLRKPDVSGRTWTQSPAVPDSPFVQSTTPNPILRKERFDLRTWLQSLSLPANVDVGSPFVQSNGPNPILPVRIPDQLGMVLSTLSTVVPPEPPVPPPDVPVFGGGGGGAKDWGGHKRKREQAKAEFLAALEDSIRETYQALKAAPQAVEETRIVKAIERKYVEPETRVLDVARLAEDARLVERLIKAHIQRQIDDEEDDMLILDHEEEFAVKALETLAKAIKVLH